MSINVSNLILKLQQKISTADNEENLLFYSKALQQLRSGTINTVNSISDLPPASENAGRLFLVKDDIAVYWAAGTTNKSWVSLLETFPKLFLSGQGICGRLGTGDLIARSFPIMEITSSSNWVAVSAGDGQTLGLKNDGTLWGWGQNDCGQLGDGSVVDKSSPVQEITSATTWSQISTNRCVSGAIKTDGTLWMWGYAPQGQLGDGTGVSKSSPVQEISSSTNWCMVSAGRTHAAGIKTNGTLWSWGNGTSGRLGNGTTTNQCSPVQEFFSAINWCVVAASQNARSVGVKTDGTLWSWGFQNAGQLGIGTAAVCVSSPVQEICSATNWCTVSTFNDSTSGLKTDGTLWGWGVGTSGQFGVGNIAQVCSPVQEICSATNWCMVSAGYSNAIALKTDGTRWGMGSNTCGSLGDGTTTARCSPVQEFTCSNRWCFISSGRTHSAGIEFVNT